MATAFLCAASAAASAPLNPAYKRDEFEFYLEDLKAKALIVEAGSETPALHAAEKLGVAVIALAPEPQAGAGAFRLSGASVDAPVDALAERVSRGHRPRLQPADGRPSGRPLDRVSRGHRARLEPAEPADVALILHTSGTTSRPKIVPLSHANIWTSARNIAASLELSANDRALNVMPFFHIHGLIAGLSAPLSRGGSVFCTPGFNALKFFAEMEEANPTWYTAVPTMHQTLLTRAGRHKEIIARHPLRFIRSSSASLPPTVIGELEAAFKCPVIEAYGMTEATHQMASNPLNGIRKPGSVGLAAGPEVAIMDEKGRLIDRGEIGEVVIRGESVTAAYENNPKANGEAFVDGWFRTGDQGVIDADGYLTLTGRLKEIINRGGEKISPREVDEALLDHPAVLQAVAFAVPHPMLGEDVGAAVVLREGLTATEQELGAFLSERLAAFKTPRKILFLAEIPKGVTGKLQRIGLAQKLGLG
jgi:acyl-CoA synthetase (AMP-forming)/AMP-acid ligase II